MQFYTNTVGVIPVVKRNIVILTPDNWDDWFTYNTVYIINYYDENGTLYLLGSIKVGQKQMETGQRRPNLPISFDSLTQEFFSLGQDASYYEAIYRLGDAFREEILNCLNDIAYNSDIYEQAIKEHVTRISLLRSVSTASVTGQYRRLAQGNAELTRCDFKFHCPKHIKSTVDRMTLEFNVIPNSNPPTNIHVIIGRNGVGKTHLFNNMISSIVNSAPKYGSFERTDGSSDTLFANLVSMSFSAFDETDPMKEIRDKTKLPINYSYIGLKRIPKDDDKLLPPKSPRMLRNEFVKSVEKCRAESKTRRWIKALELLESDPIFRDTEISQIAKLPHGEESSSIASDIFNRLSSGHKIVLLSITRLVEVVEERSLVLLDEPEGYLHPPLLSAFIRALSDLLIKRNAVAIIGTHSPVVLQEVPRSCVWRLRRYGANAIAERMEIESFGENIGALTSEVFGLEVTESGFHKILNDLAKTTDTYEDALSTLNNQLGIEGRAILRNMIYNQNEKN